MMGKNNGKLDPKLLKELLDTCHENERKAKEKYREVALKIAEIWVLERVEEINESMDAAVERLERSRRKREHKNQKKGGGNK
jgi:hypothetical protein